MNNKDQTLEQKRARDALYRVQEVEKKYNDKKHDKDRERFVSYAERLPVMILTNGLGQAMAMLLAQGKDEKNNDSKNPHSLLYYFLESWLCRDDVLAPYPYKEKLMEAIVNGERAEYLHAQAEALAWLAWLKKFTVAFLKKPVEKAGGESFDSTPLQR